MARLFRLSLCLILLISPLFARGLTAIGPSAQKVTSLMAFEEVRDLILNCKDFNTKYNTEFLLDADFFVTTESSQTRCGSYAYQVKEDLHMITLATDAMASEDSCYRGDYKALLMHEMLHAVIGPHPKKIEDLLDFILDPVERMVYLCYEKPFKGDIYLPHQLEEFKRQEKNGAL